MEVLKFSLYLAKFNLKVKYSNSVFGVIWVIINPIVLVLAYSYIFNSGDVTQLSIKYFIGLIVFLTVNETLINSSSLIVNNAHLIKKIRFNKYIIPVAGCLQVFLGHIIGICVVFAYLTYFNLLTIDWNILYFPLYLLLFFTFSLGLGFLISAIGVFGSDLLQFFSSTSILLLFVSPVFYDCSEVEGVLVYVVNANPITYFINAFREIVLADIGFHMSTIARCAGISVFTLAIGLFTYFRVKDDFVDLI